jgi:uncharacterized protein (TIGR00369 family)
MSTPLTTEEIQRYLDASPFISFLGLKVLSVDPAREEVVMRASMRPEFERAEGTGQWHGGPLAAIIDTVGDFALGMLLGRGIPTINFRVDYLRPAITTDLLVTARVRRNGRSIGVADVDIHDEKGTLLAIGRATYSTQELK